MAKKLKIQLVVAVVMVLVAALALGSATFAWFAQNNTVVANGMNVNAVAAKNLVIANNSEGAGESTIVSSAVTSKVSLRPASTSTLAGTQNYFALDQALDMSYSNYAAGIGSSFVAATPVAATATSTDTVYEVVKHSFWIRVAADEGVTLENLHVSNITVDGANTRKAISKALRVGVVCGNNGYIYAPVSGATATYNAITTAGTVATIAEGIYSNASDQALNASITALTAYSADSVLSSEVDADRVQVDVYIWYEGEDAACTSQNSIDPEDLTVSVNFTAQDPVEQNSEEQNP